MKAPFAFVLIMEHPDDGTEVAACSTLEEIEEALRRAADARWIGIVDSEIVEVLRDANWRVRVFACTARRKGQISTELEPFARTTAKVA